MEGGPGGGRGGRGGEGVREGGREGGRDDGREREGARERPKAGAKAGAGRVGRGTLGRRPAPPSKCAPRAQHPRANCAPRGPHRRAPPPHWASWVTQQPGRDPPGPALADRRLHRSPGPGWPLPFAPQVPWRPGRCRKFRDGRAAVWLGHHCACLPALAERLMLNVSISIRVL